ncbi:hydrogenase maturation protein HypF [Bacillus mesophilus]|uniref:Carbamoyltransferase n=1 Tax=Bacillus mesophilus TaxID=1808955 RepID=A0A6M0QCS3_9BACI|nr:carbamoyltransferase HypF [Bacillus mesophilus]MBM7663291.1 hydrogenase maturation protein HypF [Bacillus mesophilus]NEY74075.1 carbamoyltransferase HypF [Bacillus mesophilus]
MYKALSIMVTGRVQGVGFRPFVYSLAKKFHLTGTVQNNLDHVILIMEGEKENLVRALKELKDSPPPLSKIKNITVNEIPPVYSEEFTIILSKKIEAYSLPWVSADAAICELCLEEMNDPFNRRYNYPFINCTQCGPRYTIIQSLPYDRPNTTMSEFMMCKQCYEEYENPLNRRHHAQPICCSLCGPTISLNNTKGELVTQDEEALIETGELISSGHIIGIKGIGGFHIACDALQERAVEEIRIRKNRPSRPLAIMVRDLEVVKKYCYLSKEEVEMLTSSVMPIVVLQKRKECNLPEMLSPGLSTVGIMLPYTPLHHRLFKTSSLECMVMTSANPSGLPILYKDESLHALERLCDYILTHNRDIYLPIDDSVVQFSHENMLYFRRARGFVPDPFQTKSEVDGIIAFGGNQKNTFAIGKQQDIVISAHIGDLENEEMIQFFKNQLHHYQTWLDVEVKHIAVDKHPLYASATLVKEYDCNVIPIQHHHAHLVSCMEDNGIADPCIGIILDGTGYGDDGNLWGFEFLYGNAQSFERLGHLEYTPLPGGEKAVKETWRNAVGMLHYYWQEEGIAMAIKLFPEKENEINIIKRMIEKQIHIPMAGTCGRVFDVVSAILGICLSSSYEGEAAITLSDQMINEMEHSEQIYPFQIKTNKENLLQLNLSPMIYQIIQDKLNNRCITKIIQTFHQTIVSCCVEMITRLVELKPHMNRTVMLSGGTFQNIYLTKEIKAKFQGKGFVVKTHKNVPCHDGGLSLGQIIIASHFIDKK